MISVAITVGAMNHATVVGAIGEAWLLVYCHTSFLLMDDVALDALVCSMTEEKRSFSQVRKEQWALLRLDDAVLRQDDAEIGTNEYPKK